MTLANSIKKLVDLPCWEWARFAPVANAVAGTGTSAVVSDWKDYYVGGTPRFAYYLVNAALYRYDSWSDSWHQLQTIPGTFNTPVNCTSIEYTPTHGYFGRAIGPGPGRNTIQMAGLNGDTLIGQKIAIIGGAGAGQERTIVEVRDAVIHDAGSVSGAYVTGYAAGQIASISDTAINQSRKTWIYNQWRDYQMRVTFTSGTASGANQMRKILYNTNNTLTYSDATHAALHSWYSAPLTATPAAFGTWYQIESSVALVDTNWAIRPDATSQFVVKGGALWTVGGFGTAPFYTLAYYDILADVWYYKGTQNTVLYSATWSTYENAIELCTEVEAGVTTDWSHATPLTSNQGVISTGVYPYDKRVLIDASQNMRVNQYANMAIKITGGLGRGQSRTIVGNSTDRFIISRDWDVAPGAGSTYQVLGDSNKMYVLPGRLQGAMGIYNVSGDMMTTGRQFDYGVVRAIHADSGQQGIATVTYTGAGTNYAVGDILTLTNNTIYYGIGGKVRVDAVNAGASNAITAVSVYASGVSYGVSATAYATTSGNEGGGTGSGATITVNSNSIGSQRPIGVTGITRAAGGLLSVAVGSSGGTGYSVGDLLGSAFGGTGSNGVVRVTSITGNGVVNGLAIEQQGSAYVVTSPNVSATNVATTHLSPSAVKNGASSLDLRTVASGCTVTVLALTDIATATTGIPHNFKIGDTVWIGGTDIVVAGAQATTGQSYLGGWRTVAGVPSSTTFTYTIPGPARDAGGTAAVAAQVTPAVTGAGAVLTAVVNAAGSGGYVVGDILTFNTTGTGATARVVAASGGSVIGITLLTAGSGYGTSSTTTGGSGAGNCTVTLTVGTGVVTTVAVTTGGLGFGVITSAATSPTYAVGTGLAKVSIYSGGYGYSVGDILGISGGSPAGVLRVLTVTPAHATNPVGSVLTAQIMDFGNGYATGTQVMTAALGNNYAAGFAGGEGGGTGCTVNIDEVGSVYAVTNVNGFLVNVTGVNSTTGAITSAVSCGGTPGMPFSGANITAVAQTLVSANATIFGGVAPTGSLLVDFTKNWIPNELVGKLIQTQLGGVASATQMRRIIANTSSSISVQPVISPTPTLGATKYIIFDNKSLGTEATIKPSDPTQYAWGVATGGTNTTLIDNSTGLGTVAVAVGGTGYSVGDLITVNGGSPLGTLKVVSVSSGAVTDATITLPGNGYTASTVPVATTSSPGTGCTVQVLTTNAKNWDLNRWAGYKVKLIAGSGSNASPNEVLIASNTENTLTLATNWSFTTGPATAVYGGTDAIIAVSGGTAASLITRNTEVTTDADFDLDNITLANGIIGQVKTIYIKTVGHPTDSAKVTLTNPGTVVSFGTNPIGKSVTVVYTAGGWMVTSNVIPDTTTVYAIMDNWGVCCGTTGAGGGGVLTATTNAVGSGYKVGDILLLGTGVGGFVKVLTVTAGTGAISGAVAVLNPGSGYAAGSQSTTCLTSTGSGATITTTMGTVGSTSLIGDYYQNWGTHSAAAQSNLVNKLVRCVAGSPVVGFDSIISSVGATAGAQQLTLSAALGTAPDGNTAYSVLGSLARGGASLGGPCLLRLWGTTLLEKCRYMISFRGNNTTQIDRYDIKEDMWETISGTPLFEPISIGSMFTYNGKDRIYFTTSATGRVQYYDFYLNQIVPCSTIPYAHGAATQGNKMFIITNSDLKPDGLEYLYVIRHTGQEMWRTLIYW